MLVCRLHIAFPSFLVAHLPAGHSHAPRWKCKEYTKYMWEDSEKYCDLKYTSRSRSASPVSGDVTHVHTPLCRSTDRTIRRLVGTCPPVTVEILEPDALAFCLPSAPDLSLKSRCPENFFHKAWMDTDRVWDIPSLANNLGKRSPGINKRVQCGRSDFSPDQQKDYLSSLLIWSGCSDPAAAFRVLVAWRFGSHSARGLSSWPASLRHTAGPLAS